MEFDFAVLYAEFSPDLETPRNAVVIDAIGKHVTAGLVDAHSHTAISRGINEVTSAVTVAAGDTFVTADFGYQDTANASGAVFV